MSIWRPIGGDINFIRIRHALCAAVSNIDFPNIAVAIEIGMRVNDLVSIRGKPRFPSDRSEGRILAIHCGSPDFKSVVLRCGVGHQLAIR